MRNPVTILAALGAGLLALPAAANDEDTLDQIIVTGSRTPLTAASIGNAVTVITRSDIERRQARYVSDLLRTVPGFTVSSAGGAGSQTQVRARGAEANHILVLIDGARANDPATGDEFRWEFLTTANIERIEIVKGPQSALWGSDAIAGVVHIITRSGTDGARADGYLEAGSRDTLNGAFNASIGADTWNASLGVERLATDGINFSRTGDENDDADATTASLSISLRPNDEFALTFGARAVDAWSQYDNVDYFVTGLPADSDVALDTRQNYLQAGATIGGDDSRVRHHLAARYFDSDNRNITDGVEDVTALSERTTLAYQADIPLGGNLLSLALEHEETAFEQRGPVGFGDPNQSQDMDTTSFVTDFRVHTGGNMTWLISARYDDNSVFSDALTGRLSLSWSVTDATRLRGSIGTGRKNPTFIELYGYFPGQFINNPDLRPEKSTSVEIGLEHQITDSLNLQLTAFAQDLEDEINGFVFDPETFLSTAANLDERSKRSGIELAVRWHVSEHLGVNATYAYIDSTTENIREVRRPRHSGSIDVDYGFLDGRGTIALTADYGGTRTDTFFPPWPNPPEIVTLDDYWLLDLATRYRVSPGFRIFARATNLLDTRYEHVYGYRTPGRAVYAGVEAEFGR